MNPYDQYRKTAVGTASRGQLVIMLYEGVLRFTKQGIQAVECQDFAAAHSSFVRAQEIVTELTASLDVEVGGDLAKNLYGLYEYGYRRLVEANCRKATPPAVEVLDLFHQLLEAWREIASREVSGAKTGLLVSR